MIKWSYCVKSFRSKLSKMLFATEFRKFSIVKSRKLRLKGGRPFMLAKSVGSDDNWAKNMNILITKELVFKECTNSKYMVGKQSVLSGATAKITFGPKPQRGLWGQGRGPSFNWSASGPSDRPPLSQCGLPKFQTFLNRVRIRLRAHYTMTAYEAARNPSFRQSGSYLTGRGPRWMGRNAIRKRRWFRGSGPVSKMYPTHEILSIFVESSEAIIERIARS